MSKIPKKRFVIQPIPAREGDCFHQSCECCDSLLEIGVFTIAIQVVSAHFVANLFLGKQVDCTACGYRNNVIAIFDDENEVAAELALLEQDIRSSPDLIKFPTVPDINSADVDELFGS